MLKLFMGMGIPLLLLLISIPFGLLLIRLFEWYRINKVEKPM